MANYTPMIEQYLQIKREHHDSILFFRLGDFYEMFFEDAQLASRELEIVLTARDGGAEKIPMCGIPYHAVNNYLPRLIAKGHKVAICEQVEDPKQAAGIVKREVTRIITPGTLLEEFMLDEEQNNYLAAIDVKGDLIGFAYIDISTGDFRITEMMGREARHELDSELRRVSPAECLISARATNNSLWNEDMSEQDILPTLYPEADMNWDDSLSILYNHFGFDAREQFGLQQYSIGIQAAAMIIHFLDSTQKSRLLHIDRLTGYHSSNYLELDAFTRRNLELTAGIRSGRKEGSLLDILDHCRTSMGKRNLRRWLEQPLMNINDINLRLDGVEELLRQIKLRETCREYLDQIYDLERLSAKIGSGLVNARDLLALKKSLAVLPELKESLAGCQSAILLDIAHLDPLTALVELVDAAIDEDAGLSVKEGGIIKTGYNPEIDELRNLSTQGANYLIELENREKLRSGIKNLKVGYNRVFGYYLEVSKANINLVPPDYIRKQTLVNSERYITDELKNYEHKILGAREKLFALEYQIFLEIRQRLEAFIPSIQASAQAVADLDVLVSLAQLAYLHDYVRPQLSLDGKLDIKAGRHPVVEQTLTDSRFVPNDIHLDMQENRFAIITGPNMGGKSTYMRQAALINILAQMGSFVPANEAQVSIVDRIFTRVGAADDLSAGQSTFMVEMVELANIIKFATPQSLIILDEIGRGTSTYDGLSIAQAVSEYIHDKIKARTLFATHYHELTALDESRSGLTNLSVSVMETGESVTFLKKVLPGKADKSYGIHVAQLAGLPRVVTDRAYEVLASLENEAFKPGRPLIEQISLFNEPPSEILEELDRLDVDSLSPREALSILYKWKEKRSI
ncbi:DNA mismatch repair protein MutS, type 1 [Syntrophomonas zehnderi OL-4]|uniref:DNA mismatch repair protein MutS n=1 Tax=Syntrophomonas zehnderi OL-4 TaxID=690567 RepID=A0A0E4GBI6_9FIRM|nr:DNA mismatch repair protein MutS [Syntrophomonas zehnderi]CFX45638.1 DNA mismatch repair protein MutS, type 1 [Syntrophomonas zehnderi OL-4]